MKDRKGAVMDLWKAKVGYHLDMLTDHSGTKETEKQEALIEHQETLFDSEGD